MSVQHVVILHVKLCEECMYYMMDLRQNVTLLRYQIDWISGRISAEILVFSRIYSITF